MPFEMVIVAVKSYTLNAEPLSPDAFAKSLLQAIFDHLGIQRLK
jgi:hypothetical protein